MITTIIKHEFIRARGWLAQVFGGATLLVATGSALALTDWPMVSTFGVVLGAFAVVALLPVAQLALAWDYWRSSYRRIGYFTQTLPIRGATQYWARLIWGTAVSLLALAWSIVLGVGLWYGSMRVTDSRPADLWDTVTGTWELATQAAPAWFWVLALLLVVLLMLSNVAAYYFAASVGSERRFAGLGAGGPVLVWVLIYFAIQLAFVVAIVTVPWGVGLVDGRLGLVQQDFLSLLAANEETDVMPIGFLPVLVLMVVPLVWRTIVSWERKVSLV